MQISAQCFWCSWGILWTDFKTNPLLLLWFVYGKRKWCSRMFWGQRNRCCMGSRKPPPLQRFSDDLSGDLIQSEYPDTPPMLTICVIACGTYTESDVVCFTASPVIIHFGSSQRQRVHFYSTKQGYRREGKMNAEQRILHTLLDAVRKHLNRQSSCLKTHDWCRQ